MTDKTFEEMMRDANELPALDPDASATIEQLVKLGDAILELLEGEPLTLWGKQCIVGTVLMRLFTAEPSAERRLAMMAQQMGMFADKAKAMAALSISGHEFVDLSIPGSMDNTLPGMDHA